MNYTLIFLMEKHNHFHQFYTSLNHEKMAYFVYEELDRLLEEPGLEELKLKDSILLRPGNEQYFKGSISVFML